MIIHKGSTFYSDAPSGDTRYFVAGWKWVPFRKAWTTSDVRRVLPFLSECSPATAAYVVRWKESRQEAVSASVAATSTIKVPSPDGLAYRPYQLAGISFMRARHSVLNADVPRLGKSIQSLGLANTYAFPLKILVVCPANAKVNWTREANKWLIHKTTVGYCDGGDNPKTDFLVCNYDILNRHVAWMNSVEWDIIVADEAHYLKNPDSQRSKTFFSLPKAKLHAVFLTGTPIFTRPIDLFPLLKACDPKGLGKSWWTYATTYCDGHEDEHGRFDASGSSNEDELQYKMRSRFMIRREKADVTAEIPPARHTVYLPKTGLDHLIRAEKSAAQKNLSALMDVLRSNGDPSTLAAFDGRSDLDAAYPSARRDLALAKCKMVIEWCQELLETENKLVIFAHHRDVVTTIAKAFGDEAVIVMGGMTTDQRQGAIDAFRDDPTKRVFVGNITAAGSAISLAAADVAVFAELSWIPGEIDQAEERIWDVLKTVACTIYRLVVEDSVEAAIAEILECRQASIDRMTHAKFLAHSAVA